MALLTVTNIQKRFDAHYALHSVNFTLDAGEVLCFLGPSGCGKTTLLRIIAGLETEFTGTVTFDGKPITNVPAHKRNFGMMFQDYALFPHLSVAENVAFGLRFKQLSASQQYSRTQEMLELVGLSAFASRTVGELSGGERQRVALARSLAPQPRLLMLDEPLAALDRALRERLARDLRSILNAVGVTAIFVTHDQAEAFAIADKVAVFHDGRLEQIAAPVDLYTRPATETVARFLGFQNLLPAERHSTQYIDTPIGRLPATGILSTVEKPSEASALPPAHLQQPTLLIRPEGATLLSAQTLSAGTVPPPVPGFMHPPANTAIQLHGTVQERTFVGQNYQVYINAGEDTVLRFFLPLNATPPEIGEPISVSIPLSSIVIIE